VFLRKLEVVFYEVLTKLRYIKAFVVEGGLDEIPKAILLARVLVQSLKRLREENPLLGQNGMPASPRGAAPLSPRGVQLQQSEGTLLSPRVAAAVGAEKSPRGEAPIKIPLKYGFSLFSRELLLRMNWKPCLTVMTTCRAITPDFQPKFRTVKGGPAGPGAPAAAAPGKPAIMNPLRAAALANATGTDRSTRM
jgi:hypothetical protein